MSADRRQTDEAEALVTRFLDAWEADGRPDCVAEALFPDGWCPRLAVAHLRTLVCALAATRQRVEELESQHSARRYFEWATEAPDGTLSRADDEASARRWAARVQRDHGITLTVKCREIRVAGGPWQTPGPGAGPAVLSWRWRKRPSTGSGGAMACNICHTGNVALDLEDTALPYGKLTCLNCGATAPGTTPPDNPGPAAS